MDERESLRRRAERERRARQEAERLLEQKSAELFQANKDLSRLAEELSREVGVKTRELLAAQRVAKLGTMVWDLKSGIKSFSEGVYALLELNPEREALNLQRIIGTVHEEDRAEVRGLLSPTGQSEPGPSEYKKQFRVVLADGKQRWVELRAATVRDAVGKPRQLVATLQDVTAIKEAHEQIQRSERLARERVSTLEQLQKDLSRARDAADESNRAKSRFLAVMSHEIRTPLNGVLGTLQLLADSDLDDSQRKILNLAMSSADGLRRVTNDVIELSRLQAGRLELEYSSFDPRALLSEAADFWRPLATSKQIALQLTIDDDIPAYLRADAARIRQIIDNFVSNAIKFTDQGEIDLRLELDPMKGAAQAEDVHVRIEVQDSGIGIPKARQKELFQDFSRIDDSRQSERGGSGLGLAICRELANRMGGTVGVSSAAGAGSTFWFRVPLQRVPNDDIRREPGAPDEALQPLCTAAGTAPRVLLVEDILTNQLIAQTMLTGFGCRVDAVENGLEAVRAVRDREYDVVVMDVAMPVMDGVEATRQIRAMTGERAEIPVVGQTAFALPEETRDFLAAGMNEVVNKPLQRAALHAAVARALARDPQPPTLTASVQESPNYLDRSVLAELKENFPPEQFDLLLERVMIDIEANARAAALGANAGDLQALGRGCHALKGLGASFGSKELEKIARRIERACRAGETEEAMAMALTKLENVCEYSLAALKAYRRSLGVQADA